MTITRDAILTDTVIAATTLCPRIKDTVVKAKYGIGEERLRRLQDARRLANELVGKIALAELAELRAREDAAFGEKAS